MGNKTKKQSEDTTSSSSLASSSDEFDQSSTRRHRHRKDSRRRSEGRSSRERERRRERDEKRRKKKGRRGRDRERHEKKLRREGNKKKRAYESDENGSGSSSNGSEDAPRLRIEPEFVVRDMLKEFPNVGNDLKQLLQMIDDGQAVDIKGISERSLIKHLKKLFLSLNLKENGDRVFLLPSKVCPTLEVVGSLIESCIEPKEPQVDDTATTIDLNSAAKDVGCRQKGDDNNLGTPCANDDPVTPRRRTIGPEMPSAELLAAAAKLTEAQAELREAELEEDTETFIGPPPPAVVAEAESANEAERFEEVTRIMGVEGDSPYDVVGVNHNMSADNIKKRYWKMSLLVHPDKCSHPQAHQAFIKLNKAFKDLQDPDKRKVLDEKIKLKEEQEEFKAELKAMQEAALWRRSQGISMEGDDVLLAEMEVKVAPKRDEWMTTLPPERKPGMTMQSTKFSRGSKEGRGDTSIWTDTPSDKAQKAKMNFLEAYNETAALASNEEEKKRTSSDADLVDKYNKAKRSKSLVQKHQEKAANHSKRKSKQPTEKEDWAGQHPWKPWDREKDLAAGRKDIKLDSENMAQGLTSRFSAGTFQRNFL
ncbi:DnaJ domain containing protein [Quillaja saponaria]|uniref:DnaJ domain containing protein n=1 Tax=Quillaja saponaria TaxID=32244 RepID=A0AAD7Q3F7_QUISA|nr:DnaJ domain containing protein [Quillaja saponaria]